MSQTESEPTILASKTMKAAVIDQYNNAETYVVEDRHLPIPDPGQVLIQVAASPINPSDIAFIRGVYGLKRDLPTIPGFEGSGTVVASGGGILGWRLVGKKVAFFTTGEGTWAEYTIANAASCVVLPEGTDMEVASCSLVNPLTVMVFMDWIQKRKAKAVVSSAAASQVGKMLFKMCSRIKIPVVNIVRRQEQVELLENLGAEHIVNTSEEGWKELLKEKCMSLNATLAFDAVGGSLTGDILSSMPKNSHVALYGSLAGGQIENISPGDLIFRGKTVGGLWLSAELKDATPLTLYRMTSQIVELLKDEMKTEIQARFSLDQLKEAISTYKKNMSAGKVLIVPSLASSPSTD